MRVGLVGACLVGLLAVGCNESTKAPPSLTLSPSGTVTVLGPATFQASAVNTGGPVTWTLAGAGSLSATSGEWVTYRPPAAPAVGATATLTAASGGLSAVAHLQLSPPVLAGTRIPGLTAAVEVRYDAKEVPHIRCAQAADCFAVQGYLHARDRLFQIDFLRRVATGTLAEMVGALGLSQDVELRTIFTTRSGQRLGEALAAHLDAPSRVIVEAYISGINARLVELRADGSPLGGEYAQLPYPLTGDDVPDWTVADVMTFMRLQQYSLSSTLTDDVDFGRFAARYAADPGKMSVWVRSSQVASETSHTLTPAQAPTPINALVAAGRTTAALAPSLTAAGPQLHALAARLGELRYAVQPFDGSTGSNNWVVDAAHSATGKAMVANDPHLSLQYPPNFHLATLTSSNPADHLDVTGGAFPGTPGAQVGRGQHVGWGVTVVGYDVTDVYQEQAVPCPLGTPVGIPFCVAFTPAPGGVAWVIPHLVTFRVRVGSGAAGLVTATGVPAGVAVVPHHGPIIQAPDGAGVAFSVRWTGHEEATQDLSAFLGLDTAASVAEAMAAVSHWSTGAQNFVMADDAGNIGYSPHALVPKRSWAGTMPGGQPLLPWFPLPGDGSAEWGTGVSGDNCAGAGLTQPAAACWIADADLPQATGSTTGYLATANADPVGTTLDPARLGLPVDGHGNYLSFNWSDSTGFRHARITERLQQGLVAGGGKLTQADMESIQTDHASRFGAAFERYIAAMPAGDATFEAARTLLASWKTGGFDCPTGLAGIDPGQSPAATDPAVVGSSAGCHLLHRFVRTLLPAVFADDLAQAGLGLDAQAAVKGMLHMLANPTTADQSFCQNVDANGDRVGTTSCEQQVRAALTSAYAGLAASHGLPASGAWAWGRVHTFQPVSQFPLVTLGYEPGPFARPGGAFTVDVGNPSLSGGGTSFAYGSSANVRHVSVMDAAAPVVRMQLPGPEVSRPYGVTVGPDLLVDWARNSYFTYAHGDQILGATVATQGFTP
jgi:penicillin amidase